MYFDAATSDIRALREGVSAGTTTCDDIWVFERKLIRDILICAGMPGFPERFQKPIFEVIAKYSAEAQSSTYHAPTADYETDEARVEGLREMASRLHDIFHGVGAEGVDGFTDNPEAPLQYLYGDMLERVREGQL